MEEAVGAGSLRDAWQSADRVEYASVQDHRGRSSSGSPRVGVRPGAVPSAGGDPTPTRDQDDHDDGNDDNDDGDNTHDNDDVSPLRELRGLFGGLSLSSPVPSQESVIDVDASIW